MGAQHIIELNGKRYDAVTGKILGPHNPSKPTPTPGRRHTAPQGTVDGVRRVHKATAKPNHTARRPQKSQALMRKPAHAATTKSRTHKVTSTSLEQPWSHSASVDSKRLKRAQAIPQNRFIGRFSAKATPSAPDVTPATIPVQPAPTKAAPVAPPTLTPPASSIANPLEAAINQATSHRQPRHPKQRTSHRTARKLHLKPRTLGVLSSILVIAGIAGFVFYRQVPNMHMKVASQRSGISGAIPSYIPSGFKLGNDIDYKEGEITLNFHSNSDQRTFAVTQSESYWTSESLRQNYIESLDTPYQTIQENGKTVYLHKDGATWVDGGIWYRVDDKAAELSSTQLTNLIKGL